MRFRLLLLCVLLAMLFITCEMKKKKKDKKHGHHRHSHDHDHGPGRHRHGGKHRGRGRFEEITTDLFFQILFGGDSDDEDEEDNRSDWLYDLQEPEGPCEPNPCRNNGVCREKEKGKRKFKCDCPKPFKGKKCEKGPKHCKRGRCGRGECVVTSRPPYYECKCMWPFQPPNCDHFSVCEPNPCQNGGTCVQDGNDFDCNCSPGFGGRFCNVGPDDCYTDDGESYRGNVSETDDGRECLYWNSHFTLESGTDPFNNFDNEDGLGPHNHCRNPDGDRMPWCFYRKGPKLFWDYCDVRNCDDPTEDPATVEPTDDPEPTQPGPPPPKPTEPAPPLGPTEPPAQSTTKAPSQPTTKAPSQQTTKAPSQQTTKAPSQQTTKAPSQQTTKSPTQPTAEGPTQTPTAPAQTTPITPTNATAAQFRTCGQAQPKKPITRIYGGLKPVPGAIPWQVSVQVRPKNTNQRFGHICGGILIESCWVLTAGHCISPNKDMQVVLGSQDLSSEEPNEQVIPVEEAIKHENYSEKPGAVYNDIGLLRLRGQNGVCAEETQFVKTACLPDETLPDGMECSISGWGATETSSFGSQHLLEAKVLLINQEKCSSSKVYGKVLDNGMVCAGYLAGGVDSCQGDSGGPLTCEQNSTHVVYGVVSWGDQCGKKNRPGVYTRVTHYLDWIRSKISGASV